MVSREFDGITTIIFYILMSLYTINSIVIIYLNSKNKLGVFSKIKTSFYILFMIIIIDIFFLDINGFFALAVLLGAYIISTDTETHMVGKTKFDKKLPEKLMENAIEKAKKHTEDKKLPENLLKNAIEKAKKYNEDNKDNEEDNKEDKKE